MREYICKGCGKDIPDNEEVLIVTLGVVRAQGDERYMTERKAYVCGGCQ